MGPKPIPPPHHFKLSLARPCAKSRSARCSTGYKLPSRAQEHSLCSHRAGVKGAPGPTGSRRARLLTAIPKKNNEFLFAACTNAHRSRAGYKNRPKTRGEPKNERRARTRLPQKERDATIDR